ncbi:MAG: PIN domain-containing protein [Candidatus Ratteibacteria bacterium]|nr:PIN domain-containing protein [Candidatus Ratteibacteria bacterium]
MGIYIIRGVFIILSTLTGFYCVPSAKLIGALVGFVGSLLIVGVEILLEKVPLKKLLLAISGLLVGLITAILLAGFFLLIPVDDPRTVVYIRFALYFAFTYLGIMIGLKGVEELGFIFPFLRSVKEQERLLVVDTSVLIDGRIYELAKGGFLDYIIIIPKFVIQELQGLADSSGDMKRQRGRRGLEVLQKLRKDDTLDVKIYDADYPEIEEVDAKLVKLAADIGANILTNDSNLAKVAEVQNIKVLNLNILATLMRPKLMSGEEIPLKIIKEGKEAGQGIGYLEDGTMVIVEDGAKYQGRVIDIIIDSAIQTSTGRIIFAKLR